MLRLPILIILKILVYTYSIMHDTFKGETVGIFSEITWSFLLSLILTWFFRLLQLSRELVSFVST